QVSGPDLSSIGAARSRADLLEALVLPSASFARGFEPYVVSTVGGKLYTGIIARQTGEAVYLRTADRAEVRIPRAEVEEIAPGRGSGRSPGRGAGGVAGAEGDVRAGARA